MKYILWFAAATIIALGSASVAKAQVAVIANPSVTENSLDANTLLSIYMLNKRNWSDGSRIVVFDLKGRPPVEVEVLRAPRQESEGDETGRGFGLS